MPTAFGFRPYTFHNVVRPGLQVCAAAVYNPAGDFRPIAFGLEAGGMRYRYRIKEIVVCKEHHGECIFDCLYVDFGRVKAVRLIFDVRQCRWVIG